MYPAGKGVFHVYILTNKYKTVLYTGITGNLKQRLHDHANPKPDSKHFTAKYNCYYLVYYEFFQWPNEAIRREKQIKGYSRAKKEAIIKAMNPNWDFLNEKI